MTDIGRPLFKVTYLLRDLEATGPGHSLSTVELLYRYSHCYHCIILNKYPKYTFFYQSIYLMTKLYLSVLVSLLKAIPGFL